MAFLSKTISNGANASSNNATSSSKKSGWSSFTQAVKNHHDSVTLAYGTYYGDARLKKTQGRQ